jgi:hypothetical protein
MAAAKEAALKGTLPALSRGRLNTSHLSNAMPAQHQRTAVQLAARQQQ